MFRIPREMENGKHPDQPWFKDTYKVKDRETFELWM